VINQNECVIIFSVRGGIFGVGRLATRLVGLAADHRIGEWHIGHWIDWSHSAIRISFENAADAACAKSACYDAATA